MSTLRTLGLCLLLPLAVLAPMRYYVPRQEATEPCPSRSLFDLFDHDGDGSIDIDELRATMRAMGLSPSEAQLQDLIQLVDHNHNGTIERQEFSHLFLRMLSKALRSRLELAQFDKIAADNMVGLQERLAQARTVFHPERPIRHIVLLVVVAEEIAPVLARLQAQPNAALTDQLLGLAQAYTAQREGLRLTVLQVAHSSQYCRHYSGFSQSAALAALAAKILLPDVLISFGTSGGMPNRTQIGEALIAQGCVFMDRIRTSSKRSFDWGIFGGPTLPTPRMDQALGLRKGLIGSQVGYEVGEVQVHLMEKLGVAALDMEAAAIAQILMQTGTNFIAVKVISNGIYPDDAARMEAEYQTHKAAVSQKAVQVLEQLIDYLQGKTPAAC